MVDSASLSWLRSELWIAVVAALGGAIVFIGLLMEYISTDEKRYEKADINGFRQLKSLEKMGEKWVMFGIVVEIAVAIGFAWRDDWHIRQIEIAQQKADPHNLPIKSLTAYAMVEVRPLQALLDVGNLAVNVGAKNVRLKNQTEKKLTAYLEVGRSREMSSTNWDNWGKTEVFSENVSPSVEIDPAIGNEQLLRFDIYFDGNSDHFFNLDKLSANDVDAIAIALPIHCEIVDGKIEMTINDSIEKKFQIPKQITFIDVATSIATNGNFVPFKIEFRRPQ